MARSTRSRLTEVRVRAATADDAKHGRQLFDGLGSNGLYLHVTRGGTPAPHGECTVTECPRSLLHTEELLSHIPVYG